jgi:hypothetical protein
MESINNNNNNKEMKKMDVPSTLGLEFYVNAKMIVTFVPCTMHIGFRSLCECPLFYKLLFFSFLFFRFFFQNVRMLPPLQQSSNDFNNNSAFNLYFLKSPGHAVRKSFKPKPK